MAREMSEQPDRLRDLIGRFDTIVEQVRAVAPVTLNGITIVGRGSSDHAAVFGRYLLEAATGKPAYTVAPNAALEEVLRRRPANMRELIEVRGIGRSFCEKHGESMLAALRALDEHRPSAAS